MSKVLVDPQPSSSKSTNTAKNPIHPLLIAPTSRIPETLPQEVLTKLYAAPKPDYEIITPDKLATFDAFILGIPTRYGSLPAQWKVRPSPSPTRTTNPTLPPLDILGCHRPTLDERIPLREIRRRLRLHR